MDLVLAIRTFVRVVEAGSFTAVAAEFHSTQPTVSRQIAALEQHLGARLLTRTTRALTLTEDGRQFYDYARGVLEALAQAESAVGRRRARPSGLLRLACGVAFGRTHIVPRLARFLARHPDVRIDLVMSDSFTDLVEEGIDLAIRVGEVTDPSMVAKRIGVTRRVTVASPDYLARRGAPRTPHDLVDHDCIVYTRLATGNRWEFAGPQGPMTVAVDGPYRVNSSEGVREGMLNGLGIAVLAVWLFTDEIESGRATVLLRDFEPKRIPMYAVYPSRRFVPPKVRAMIAFLEEEFRQEPTLSAVAP